MTLGKFAPFHQGHQLVVERALAENERVIVLIYSASEFTSIPLSRRAEWIRTIFPTVEVIECQDGPMEVGETQEIKRMHEEYILKVLAGRKVDRFYSSEFYGEHVSAALGAKDCRVDPGRNSIPISATLIRQSPYAHRQFISAIVYRDLITKVVFLGAPSTGKTTLARALAAHYRTVWMPEYGREYWETHQVDRRLTPEQLVEIAEGHRALEDTLIMEANRYFFVDTDASTTRHFAIYYHGYAAPQLESLARESSERYDFVVLCDDDIPFDDTWDRSGEVNRKKFQKAITADLIEHQRPYILAGGTLEERLEKVTALLESN